MAMRYGMSVTRARYAPDTFIILPRYVDVERYV